MSAKSLLKSAHRSLKRRIIAILEISSQSGGRGGRINAVRATEYSVLKEVECIWLRKESGEENQGGEIQSYHAVVLILTDDVSEIQITPAMRIQSGKPVNGLNPDLQWKIDTVETDQEYEGFSVVRVALSRPKSGGLAV